MSTSGGDVEKEALNLIIIGHVDAGKSTLMGHFLLQSGMVDKKLMHKYEQESRKMGKQSFMYAWILDETGEERNRLNLTSRPSIPELSTWYSGPCLLEVMDSFRPPSRQKDRPFCLCISDVFKGSGSGQSVAGRVDAGTVRVGDKVLLLPQGESGVVKTIAMEDDPRQSASAGDRISLTVTGIDSASLTLGSCLCDPKDPVKVAERFEARVVVFNVTAPLTKGLPVLFHYQSVTEAATVRRILAQVHKSTGEVVKEKPRCLPKNSCGTVVIQMSRPICLELFKNVREMGRFMLRSEGATLAAGMVTRIIPRDSM
ncbi:unnamed protein product [Cyprideis torosa]|uniref:Uncharacterized protein n=1 Tax=Cyprideis torosa TaxID=163714 RepID=A0A7R8WC08_9CRUS|nr:unnamed protein product [Cyprideis torosa]CAG0886902.1 unnamed protein product [Cyprideis torosa]